MDRYHPFLSHVQQIAKSCHRPPEEIQVIAVSKHQPIDRLHGLYQLGCRDFAENRVQEMLTKIPLMPECRWHFIGPLQSNKINKIVGKEILIHSIHSLELAKKVSKSAFESGYEQPILLQINISGEKSKQGFSQSECQESIQALLKLPSLKIKGLMTMAPLTEDVSAIRYCFRSLKQLLNDLRSIAHQVNATQASFEHLSMGMSNDYVYAIEEGATLLRIGSALF